MVQPQVDKLSVTERGRSRRFSANLEGLLICSSASGLVKREEA